MGIVLRFQVPEAVAARYPVRVGARDHAELGVPAEELEMFNDSIVGLIEVAEIWWAPA